MHVADSIQPNPKRRRARKGEAPNLTLSKRDELRSALVDAHAKIRSGEAHPGFELEPEEIDELLTDLSVTREVCSSFGTENTARVGRALAYLARVAK